VAKQTRRWAGPTDQAIKLIMQAVNIDQDQYQLGKTKIFIKAPESLSLLEELRDRKYNEHALVLQKAFRKHNAVQYFLKLKNEAADLMYQKKERRSLSVNRKFYGDYIGLDNKPALRALINKREQIEFAQTCIKYNRQFKKQKRDFILTNKAFYIIGREEEEGKNAGGIFNKFNRNNNKKLIETIKRRIDYNSVEKIVLSHLQDNFLVANANFNLLRIKCVKKYKLKVALNRVKYVLVRVCLILLGHLLLIIKNITLNLRVGGLNLINYAKNIIYK